MLRRSEVPVRRRAAFAAVAGIFIGALIVTLDAVLFAPRLPTDLAADVGQRVAPWMGLLASIYGAVDEEVLLRLGIMTFLASGLARLTGSGRTDPQWLVWTSLLGAAVLFGVGHLPATAVLARLTPIVVVRAVVLNGLGGVLYGWLYWREGLALAMVAHAGTDLVLHVLAPMMVGRA